MGESRSLGKQNNWKINQKYSYTSTDILGTYGCILFVYTLLIVVSYYDFECSVNVSDGFKKVWIGCELYPVFYIKLFILLT